MELGNVVFLVTGPEESRRATRNETWTMRAGATAWTEERPGVQWELDASAASFRSRLVGRWQPFVLVMMFNHESDLIRKTTRPSQYNVSRG